MFAVFLSLRRWRSCKTQLTVSPLCARPGLVVHPTRQQACLAGGMCRAGPCCSVTCCAKPHCAVLSAASLVKAVLLATVGNDNTVQPQHLHDHPHTVTPTDSVQEWDVINLTRESKLYFQVYLALGFRG